MKSISEMSREELLEVIGGARKLGNGLSALLPGIMFAVVLSLGVQIYAYNGTFQLALAFVCFILIETLVVAQFWTNRRIAALLEFQQRTQERASKQ